MEEITPLAVAHRKGLQKRLKELLALDSWTQAFGVRAGEIQATRDLFGSVRPRETGTCEALCAILDMPMGSVAVLHARRSKRGPEGLGRTSVVLQLMGASVQNAPFGRARPEEILEGGPMTLRRSESTAARLVASDYAFLWCEDGELFASPPVGEELLGLWDLARHVDRLTDPGYVTGKRLTPAGRKRLEALAKVLPAAPFVRCYAEQRDKRRITLAIVLELTTRFNRVHGEICDSAAKDVLRCAFESVLFLGSGFWDRHPKWHRARVAQVIAGMEKAPKVVRVLIPADEHHVTDKVTYLARLFDEIERTMRAVRA